MCIPILVTTSPSGSAIRNHCRTHPAPCVRPRCVCSVLRAHVQFCRFDEADNTADVQWHCNPRPPLWYHYFPAQSSLGADILVYWIGKIVRTCAPGGSRTLDFLRARRAPYPLGQPLRSCFYTANQALFSMVTFISCWWLQSQFSHFHAKGGSSIGVYIVYM